MSDNPFDELISSLPIFVKIPEHLIPFQDVPIQMDKTMIQDRTNHTIAKVKGELILSKNGFIKRTLFVSVSSSLDSLREWTRSKRFTLKFLFENQTEFGFHIQEKKDILAGIYSETKDYINHQFLP